MNLLILFVVLFGAVGLLYVVLLRLGLLKPGARERSHPYRLKERLLSPGEAAFLSALRAALVRTGNGGGLGVPGSTSMPAVYAMVRMCDVLEVDPRRVERRSTGGGRGGGGAVGWQAAQNRIDRKHFDFVLVEPASTRPLLVVELDDKTHNRPDRRKRDGFVDAACAAAGLPILHVRARAPGVAYDTAVLAAEIEGAMGGA